MLTFQGSSVIIIVNFNKEMDKLIRSSDFKVKYCVTRKALGEESARDAASAINTLLAEKDEINIIFAAAPSQCDFLECFCARKDVDFSRINAFHMDEYIGLGEDAPQGFGNFLNRFLFSKVGFKSVHYLLRGNTKPEDAAEKYTALLKKYPADIVCMGIGENGHIAFNDPAFAEFYDKKLVKIVELDNICRTQQVNDKCFDKLADVPTHALTLTIPALTAAKYHFCMVPTKFKAQAVKNTLCGEITEKCPASILRTCENTVLYLDSDSASLLNY